MKRVLGFTIIDVAIIAIVLAAIVLISFLRQDDTSAVANDRDRKIAINTIYYNLEEVFYRQNGYYPTELSAGKLPAMDPALLIDPDGNKLGLADSDYRYEAADCDDDRCQSYTLRADLQREADFVKTSQH